MNKCVYCNLSFQDKKTLASHQKTKKCLAHRHLLFTCTKCLARILGYENSIEHTRSCAETPPASGTIDYFLALINASGGTEFSISALSRSVDEINISVTRKKIYTHPISINMGITAPLKLNALQKTLAKPDILGSHGTYINDVFSTILNTSEPIACLSSKEPFARVVEMWLEGPCPSVWVHENQVYAIAAVQCQSDEGHKWSTDTSRLSPTDSVARLTFMRDPELARLFSNFSLVVKDMLNLYIGLAKQVFRKEKIKKAEAAQLDAVFAKYPAVNLLAANIKCASEQNRFAAVMSDALQRRGQVERFHNLRYVFSQELLPLKLFHSDAYSLMSLHDHELSDHVKTALMYVLPESERVIFSHKQ